MPVTLTIKQVPEALADVLRRRAAASHRSLQGELMAILEEAVHGGPRVESNPPAPYHVKPAPRPVAPKSAARGRRLTLAELWERSRRLGAPGASESAAIVRKLRDERDGR